MIKSSLLTFFLVLRVKTLQTLFHVDLKFRTRKAWISLIVLVAFFLMDVHSYLVFVSTLNHFYVLMKDLVLYYESLWLHDKAPKPYFCFSWIDAVVFALIWFGYREGLCVWWTLFCFYLFIVFPFFKERKRESMCPAGTAACLFIDVSSVS